MKAKKSKKSEIEKIAYSTDASMIPGNASSVIFPSSVEQISILIRGGNNFTIRGGGTGLAGGAVPLNSIVLDLSKMNKILEVDRDKRTAEVEPGIILDELNSELEKDNLEFPIQPSSHAVCTIGGMIATNAVGSRALKYGRTSNWIEELEIVNGKSEIIRADKVSLQDFAGMEGITGIITKAKLKLAEKKERTASLFSMESLKEVYESAKKLKMLDDVSAIEFLDKLTSSLLGLKENYHIIAEFESDRGKAKNREYNELMELRDKAYPMLATAGFTRIEDPKILLHKFQELGEFLEIEKVPFFGHLSAGILHPVFRKEDNEKIKSLMRYVKKMQGQVTGEHGIGLSKKEFLENTEKKLYSIIKKRHDPLCKINCGKIIDLEKEVIPSVNEERKKDLEKIEQFIKQENEESQQNKINELKQEISEKKEETKQEEDNSQTEEGKENKPEGRGEENAG